MHLVPGGGKHGLHSKKNLPHLVISFLSLVVLLIKPHYDSGFKWLISVNLNFTWDISPTPLLSSAPPPDVSDELATSSALSIIGQDRIWDRPVSTAR